MKATVIVCLFLAQRKLWVFVSFHIPSWVWFHVCVSVCVWGGGGHGIVCVCGGGGGGGHGIFSKAGSDFTWMLHDNTKTMHSPRTPGRTFTFTKPDTPTQTNPSLLHNVFIQTDINIQKRIVWGTKDSYYTTASGNATAWKLTYHFLNFANYTNCNTYYY